MIEALVIGLALLTAIRLFQNERERKAAPTTLPVETRE